jgi:hypothetical protein
MSRRHARTVSRPHLTVLDASRTAPPPSIDDVTLLAERIAAGELDGQLRQLAPVIAQRLRLLSSADTLAGLASFKVGDRVVFKHTVRPLYLHGARGRVEGWLGQRVVVRLDYPIGRFLNAELRCEPGGLEKLSAE